MLQQLPAPDHVVAYSLGGKPNSDELREYQSVLADSLQERGGTALLVDLTELTDISKQALKDSAGADDVLLRRLGQLDRCALVSDKDWLHVVASFAGQLVPTLQVQAFGCAQREQALAWVARAPQRRATTPSAIRFLATRRDDVLAFEVDGLLTANEMPAVIQHVQKQLGAHAKLRLLGRITTLAGFEPSALMSTGLLPMKLSAMRKVDRYAIVGAPRWMRTLVSIISPLIPGMTMRSFAAAQEADAWAWLGTEPPE